MVKVWCHRSLSSRRPRKKQLEKNEKEADAAAEALCRRVLTVDSYYL